MIAPLEAPAYCRADRFLAWAAALDESAPPKARRAPAAARVLAPLRRRRARELAAGAPLLLRVGCDADPTDGWIEASAADGRCSQLRWDLSRPLPLPPASVESIFHEHLLERFSYAQGVELHRRCLAVLRPGGVLRIRVTDAGAALQEYGANVGGDASEWPMAMARVACLTADLECRALYDAETLELSCVAAGFPRADQLDFGEGDGACLYVEATA
ncbi:MAG TPA: hypothetical protein VEX36_05030 [Thermoleophilaceae bacterium]|nr:hypothetical protein [Thermoleophilaceae bacterium]